MKLTKTKRSHSVVFNLTPMIDIVFLLIIFFMTVSQITRVVDQPMTLPEVEVASESGPPAAVTINLTRDGKIVVSGREFTADRVMQILGGKLEELGDEQSRLRIELRCDKGCPSNFVNDIVSRLSGLGVEQINIAVTGAS